jgi:hypothetical protein
MWPSLLAEAFGAFLGTALGAIVGMRLIRWEQRQQQQREERAKAEKALHYLRLLSNEIQQLSPSIAPSIEALTEKQWGRVFTIETLLWDVVQASGELPGLIDNPELLRSLTYYYGGLDGARRAMDWIVQAWLAQPDLPGYNAKLHAFKSLALEGLESARNETDRLPELLEQQIQRLKVRVDSHGR